MPTYPPQFAFMQLLASKCDLVGNDDDCAKFLSAIGDDERQQFVKIYATLVELDLKDALDQWFEGAVSKDRSEAFRLLVLLDYMARHDMIPPKFAATRFIEWDTRDFDDDGNEW